MMWSTIKNNPISAFSVILVAYILGLVTYMMVWQTTVLTSEKWCANAMASERIASTSSDKQAAAAVKSCNELLAIQLNAVATDSHMDHGTVAILIIVLVVVVIAGARAAWKLSTSGFEGSVSRDDEVDEAADKVAGAAVDKAEEIKATP